MKGVTNMAQLKTGTKERKSNKNAIMKDEGMKKRKKEEGRK